MDEGATNIQSIYVDERIKKYRALDANSKKVVDFVLDTEYERTEQAKKSDQ